MGKKTSPVKGAFKAIKTKFDYATCAGSKFENKVKESLKDKITDQYQQCAQTQNWSPDNLRFNGEATNNTITITISAPIPKPSTDPPRDLIKSVIDEAKNALKSAAKTNKTTISEYNWTKPTVNCSTNKDDSIITINIIGDNKTLKTSK